MDELRGDRIMLQAKTRWVINEGNRQKAEELVNKLQLTPLVANLLVNRGIDTAQEANLFLDSNSDFHHPFLLNDMDICVERVHQAIRNGEKIVVYGDYDADGVTSTYVLLKTLHTLGANADYYIPNRFTEGYGPNEQAFRNLKDAGYELLITVDNGISGIHEAKVAKEIGIDLIVTDHHEPGLELPDCLAIIHPKRQDSTYPFQELAGVGVAYKVATALLGEAPEELLPFVAIGTIADLVPLRDENRLFVKKGLPLLQTSNHLGLKALMQKSGINQQALNEETISFGLAPRINAPGRLEHAGIVVDLFLSNDKKEAEFLASEIDDLNKERQTIVEQMTNEALTEINQSVEHQDSKVILIGKENWHPGVIGIVASRLVEKYYRPAIVFSYDSVTGLAKGSARSIPKFNMYTNLSQSTDILLHFGGHPMAAGMTLKIEDVSILRKRLNDLAHEQLTAEDFIPITNIDGVFSLEDINLLAIEEMYKLAPFGVTNPKPNILINDVQLPQLRKVGADQKHVKLTIETDHSQLDGIGFHMGYIAEEVSPISNVSVVGELDINEWNNVRKPQLILKDVAVNEWQLFDFRSNRKLNEWMNQIPTNNRKFIIFRENTIKQMNLTNNSHELAIIHSEAAARDCVLDGMNVVLVDFPQSKQQLQYLLSGKKVARIYAHFHQEEIEMLNTMPTRDDFKWYYAFLYKKGVFDLRQYGVDLARRKGWSVRTLKFMTTVFFELDFVTMSNGIITVVKTPEKRDLSNSKTYQSRQEIIQLEKNLLLSSYKQLKENLDLFIGTAKLEEAELWI